MTIALYVILPVLFIFFLWNAFDGAYNLGKRHACESMRTLRNLPRIRSTGQVMPLDSSHQTEHFRITKWIKSAQVDLCQLFYMDGPGQDGKMYVALCDECGPQLIQSLERAYCVGFDAGLYTSQMPEDNTNRTA